MMETSVNTARQSNSLIGENGGNSGVEIGRLRVRASASPSPSPAAAVGSIPTVVPSQETPQETELRKRLSLLADDTESLTAHATNATTASKRLPSPDPIILSATKPRSMSTSVFPTSPSIINQSRRSLSTHAGQGCCGSGNEENPTSAFLAHCWTILGSNAGILTQTTFTLFLPLMILVILIGIILARQLEETHEADAIKQNLQLVDTLHQYLYANGQELVLLYSYCLSASTMATGSIPASLPIFPLVSKQSLTVDTSLQNIRQYLVDHEGDNVSSQPHSYVATSTFLSTATWMNWQQFQRTQMINSTDGWYLDGLRQSVIPSSLNSFLLDSLTDVNDISSTLIISPSSTTSLINSMHLSSNLSTIIVPLIQSYAAVHSNLLSSIRDILRDTQIKSNDDDSYLDALSDSIETEEYIWMQIINNLSLLSTLTSSALSSEVFPYLEPSLQSTSSISLAIQHMYERLTPTDQTSFETQKQSQIDASILQRLTRLQATIRQAIANDSITSLVDSYSTLSPLAYINDALVPANFIHSFAASTLFTPILANADTRYTNSLRSLNGYMFLLIAITLVNFITATYLLRNWHQLQKNVILSNNSPDKEGIDRQNTTVTVTGLDDQRTTPIRGVSLNLVRQASLRSENRGSKGLSSGLGSAGPALSRPRTNTDIGGFFSSGSFSQKKTVVIGSRRSSMVGDSTNLAPTPMGPEFVAPNTTTDSQAHSVRFGPTASPAKDVNHRASPRQNGISSGSPRATAHPQTSTPTSSSSNQPPLKSMTSFEAQGLENFHLGHSESPTATIETNNKDGNEATVLPPPSPQFLATNNAHGWLNASPLDSTPSYTYPNLPHPLGLNMTSSLHEPEMSTLLEENDAQLMSAMVSAAASVVPSAAQTPLTAGSRSPANRSRGGSAASGAHLNLLKLPVYKPSSRRNSKHVVSMFDAPTAVVVGNGEMIEPADIETVAQTSPIETIDTAAPAKEMKYPLTSPGTPTNHLKLPSTANAINPHLNGSVHDLPSVTVRPRSVSSADTSKGPHPLSLTTHTGLISLNSSSLSDGTIGSRQVSEADMNHNHNNNLVTLLPDQSTSDELLISPPLA